MVSVWEVNFACVLMVCRRCCRRQPHNEKAFDRESRTQFRPGVFFVATMLKASLQLSSVV